MSQQRRKSQKKQRRQRRKQRGGDTSVWGNAAFGAMGSQAASPGTGNALAVHNLAGVNLCSSNSGVAANAAPVMGGNRRRRQGGRGILTDVAVPAVLLYANQMVKPRTTMVKKSKRNFSRKLRRY